MPGFDTIAEKLIRAVEKTDSRRASPRVRLTAEVDLSSDTNFFSGFSTDIAEGGLFIASLTMLEVGEVVTIAFTLPDGTEINTTGEVRWVRAFDERSPQTLPGMGVAFGELGPKAAAAIESFIAQREPMFFPD